MAQYKTYDRIKELCKAQNRTVAQLERDAGLKKNTVKRWETSSPMAKPLFKVADALNVSARYLISEEEM